MRFFIFCIFLYFNSIIFSQTSLKEINLKNGKFKVGYQHYNLTDYSRTYQIKGEFNNQTVARPIPISIWYPAKKTLKSAESNTVLDYLQILKEEEEWKNLPDYFLLDWFHYLWNTTSNEIHLKEKVTAHFNAKKLDQKFPVIIYHPSLEKTSIENFALMEFLASHGYIIVATPSRGINNKKLEGTAINNISTQVQNLEFIIQHIHQLKNVDSNKTGLMGYSFGGLTNTILAMKNRNIDALISLDGTERYNYELLEKLPFFNISQLKIPYIHFAQKDIPEEILKKEKMSATINSTFKLYDTLQQNNNYSYKFHNLTHSYFNSFDVLFANRDKRQDKSDVKIMQSYKLLAQHSLQFLNAFLKNDKKARMYIENSPKENGFTENLIFKKMKKAKDEDFIFTNFNDLAVKQNYQNLIDLYRKTKVKHPDLKLNEGMLNTLGLRLSFNPKKFQQGINVFLLALDIYPKSSNLYDSLAEAYFYNKDFKNAILSFKKSLELNPKNENAINRIKELEN